MHGHYTKTNRRIVLKAGAALAGAVCAPFAFRRAAAAESNALYVNTWGGIFTASENEAFFKPFTKETGIQIKPVTPLSYTKLKVQVQTGNYDWDVSWSNPTELLMAQAEHLVQPIDWSVMQREKLFSEAPFRDIGLWVGVLSTNLVYRKDKFPKGGPRSWADFWDVKKYPGNRAMYDRSFTMICFALLADGVPRDKLYPLDLDRAFKKLDQIKPHVKVFYTQGSQQQQLIRDGEVDMLPMWNGRASELIHQGIPIELVWDGAEHAEMYYYVAKGSPRAKLAWQYAQFCSRADRQGDFCERMTYGPANPKAFDYMKPGVRQELPTWPANKAMGFSHDSAWLTSRLPALKERWDQWKTG
jgi:putative spermidine/putrescine transport system substrate-binding protein